MQKYGLILNDIGKSFILFKTKSCWMIYFDYEWLQVLQYNNFWQLINVNPDHVAIKLRQDDAQSGNIILTCLYCGKLERLKS